MPLPARIKPKESMNLFGWNCFLAGAYKRSGNWYAVLRGHDYSGTGFYSDMISAWKSADGGETWDKTGSPFSTRSNWGWPPFDYGWDNVSGCRNKNKIAIVYLNMDNQNIDEMSMDVPLVFREFDMLSETWGAASSSGPQITQVERNTYYLSFMCLPRASDYIVFYANSDATFPENYEGYAKYTTYSSGWGGENLIVGPASPGVYVDHYFPVAACLDSAGGSHVIIDQAHSLGVIDGFTQFVNNWLHYSVSPSNVLSSPTTVLSVDSSIGEIAIVHQVIAFKDNLGVERLAVAYDYTNDPLYVIYHPYIAVSDDLASPSFTSYQISDVKAFEGNAPVGVQVFRVNEGLLVIWLNNLLWDVPSDEQSAVLARIWKWDGTLSDIVEIESGAGIFESNTDGFQITNEVGSEFAMLFDGPWNGGYPFTACFDRFCIDSASIVSGGARRPRRRITTLKQPKG